MDGGPRPGIEPGASSEGACAGSGASGREVLLNYIAVLVNVAARVGPLVDVMPATALDKIVSLRLTPWAAALGAPIADFYGADNHAI